MIIVEDLCVKLGDFKLNNININVKKGEFYTLLGPTGSGKSVILEAIAGVKPIKKGKIIINKRDITSLKPEKRFISICYQDYCLFPHINVEDNIKYGLRFKSNAYDIEYTKNYNMLIEFLEIKHLLKRYPLNLSGGEKQRISLARALVVKPDVLLLDEPLSALDPNIKERIQYELKRIHETFKITTIMVTHDFREAHYLADRAGIISNGNIIQQGTIDEIFQRPKTKYVAEFVGVKTFLDNEGGEYGIDYPCCISIRPEQIKISNKVIKCDYSFVGKIISLIDFGIYIEVKLMYKSEIFTAYLTTNYMHDIGLGVGDDSYFGFNKKDINILK